MSSEHFWDRLNETYREAGIENRTRKEDYASIDAMADQIVSVNSVIVQWDSPRLYENEGARDRCLAVLKSHRFVGTEDVTYHAARWDVLGNEPYLLPEFDPNDVSQASVPRVIFAVKPNSVRICRGTVYDSLTGVLLSIAAKTDWLCDWNKHPIVPVNTQHALPYLLLKAMGDYLVVFVVCTQCLECVIHRGADEWRDGPNTFDREFIDGVWQPRWRKSNKRGQAWEINDYPENFSPAAYLINGIRFIVPQRLSQWRENDNRTYDYIPD